MTDGRQAPSRRRTRRAIAAGLATLILTLGATMIAAPAHAARVRLEPVHWDISGSTQMYTLGALLADRYTHSQAGGGSLQIAVNPTSSQKGFDDTCQHASFVGMTDVYIQDIQLIESPACGDMIGIPVAISGTPVVYNLPGPLKNQRAADGFTLLHPVRLTPALVAAIYSCQITMWNDPQLVALNRGFVMPAHRIETYVSSEPGGSGFVFDQWLTLSVPSWAKAVGLSLQPPWPKCSIGQASSGAMVNAIKNTPYSIGFAGFDYAISYHLQAAALQNSAGVFQSPSLNGLSAAINSAIAKGMPNDFRAPFVTIGGPNTFNPACFEFFVVHKNLAGLTAATPAIRNSVKSFLQWSVDSSKGQLFIEQIEFRKIGKKTQLDHGFLPVPETLRATIKAEVDGIVTQ